MNMGAFDVRVTIIYEASAFGPIDAAARRVYELLSFGLGLPGELIEVQAQGDKVGLLITFLGIPAPAGPLACQFVVDRVQRVGNVRPVHRSAQFTERVARGIVVPGNGVADAILK